MGMRFAVTTILFLLTYWGAAYLLVINDVASVYTILGTAILIITCFCFTFYLVVYRSLPAWVILFALAVYAVLLYTLPLPPLPLLG